MQANSFTSERGPVTTAEQAPLVLIVEDNATNARLASDMLHTAGYETRVAQEGSAGLELARALQPALVLTDLQMPGMDGMTLIRELKSDPLTASIPVVAVTAHVLPEHRDEALRAGCCAFITKPFRFRPFLAEIAHAIDSCRSTR